MISGSLNITPESGNFAAVEIARTTGNFHGKIDNLLSAFGDPNLGADQLGKPGRAVIFKIVNRRGCRVELHRQALIKDCRISYSVSDLRQISVAYTARSR